MEQKNCLEQAASAYLWSARHQAVSWQEWGEPAFAQAQQEDKPILLDVGAAWCHWCHVMARESYEHEDIARLINDQFVAIKVDRDERPDIDARYQAAVSAISGQAGWPLTVFLTSEGKPYFGGGYFPPEERYGRPSFARVLRSMAEAYQTQREDVEESAASVIEAVEQNETFAGGGPALDQKLLEAMLTATLQPFDARHGGFGSQPKFPHAAALDLLIDTASRPGALRDQSKQAVEITLTRMAKGGLYDQLAGGFHRYSVDERWVLPRFEKMVYDNSELLRVYAHAYQSFGSPLFARVAEETLAWMDRCLSDREHGGFFSSQSANVSTEEDGEYFTWTRAEAEAVLTPEEFRVIAGYFHLRSIGHMQHNPAKNVLYVMADVPDLAAELHMPEATLVALLRSGKAKLLAARIRREAPYIDRTLYVGWNGLCISAYLAAGQALHLAPVTSFALKSLDRVLAAAWHPKDGLGRVVAYGERAGTTIPGRIHATLDDHAFLGLAALDAWEATGEARYFDASEQLAERLLSDFCDVSAGGFFDIARDGGKPRQGALIAHRKPLQDDPTPAGNAAAATLLLRLHALTGSELYRQRAEETLALFSGVVEHLGLSAASYGQALRRFLVQALLIIVLGEGEEADELMATALKKFEIGKSVVRIKHGQASKMPPALRKGLARLEETEQGACALVCTFHHGQFDCRGPVRSCNELIRLLQAEA